ncbi:MAG: LPS export ABC transporter periplasmic protein LptC [Candidatus Omnitrophica bacterium]|nr:LPS export ABC transporter periplasmic protein LptC [Candidatus Omnitrophota bacterium]
MIRVAKIVCLASCALLISTPAWADDRQWDDVKASLKRGAYREALQSLDILLSVSPSDARAQLYRTLCERRLASPQRFAAITPAQLGALKQQLRAEERSQQRASAQQGVLDRRLQQEQARWDRELETLHRRAERDRKLAAQREQAQALERARAERAATRQRAQELAVAQQELISTERPVVSPAAQEPSSPPTLRPSVELAPVIVPTAPSAPADEALVTPSEERRPPPAGAVQINARRMSMSPDRKIAIAEGDVEVIFENAVLTADHMTLFTDTNDVYAEGRVRLEDGAQVSRGEMVHYNFKTKKGRFLQGTVATPPWYQHGRSVEHIAEGVYAVTPGYLTSCDHEPPHFRFFGRRATVFAEDKLARARNVALFVEQMPFLYLPWLSVADRQSPFFLLPGKHKQWGQFALSGYRYELPGGDIQQKGSLKLDWRRNFRWGFGVDHQLESPQVGKGLLKLYYQPHMNGARKVEELPKGAKFDRYRVLWRHQFNPLPDTSVITDFQKYSDVDFRKELLFRDEFEKEDTVQNFVSAVTNTPYYSLSAVMRKRMNRFQSVDDALPQVTFDVRDQRIGDTQLFSQSKLDFANFQSKTAHSDSDTAALRLDWFQQLSYALGWFRPVLVTPKAAIRQSYYDRGKVGTERDVFAGQFSMGADASLKLFRVFPITTNVLGLDLHWLRHVLTPTVGYSYIHQPTVPNDVLNFAAASSTTNQLSFGLENKLQTKRPGAAGELSSVDLARTLVSIPYTFHGNGNKQGGRVGDWAFDLEFYPWPWMRLESDWKYPSHFVKGSRDSRVTAWNLDLVMVGGRGGARAQDAPDIQAPGMKTFEAGPRAGLTALLMPQGQWYLGLGHRFSHNDKTEDVVQYDWRLSQKWEIGTFHRFTWKEVAGTAKRFHNLREYQYVLRRDLHDWIGELTYRVDREFGEELWFTMTLKAYPEIPIEMETSYHQPKLGSQSSPFSPVPR